MLVDAANHLNNFGCQQLLRTCNIIKVSHRNLLHFKFISIILSLNDGDFNRYDENRLPTAIGNMLIWEKGFATFNSFSLQNSFYVNNSYVKGTRRLPQVSSLSCLDNPIGYIHSPAQNYAERVFRFMEDCNDTFFWNYDIYFRTFFRFFSA